MKKKISLEAYIGLFGQGWTRNPICKLVTGNRNTWLLLRLQIYTFKYWQIFFFLVLQIMLVKRIVSNYFHFTYSIFLWRYTEFAIMQIYQWFIANLL